MDGTETPIRQTQLDIIIVNEKLTNEEEPLRPVCSRDEYARSASKISKERTVPAMAPSTDPRTRPLSDARPAKAPAIAPKKAPPKNGRHFKYLHRFHIFFWVILLNIFNFLFLVNSSRSKASSSIVKIQVQYYDEQEKEPN